MYSLFRLACQVLDTNESGLYDQIYTVKDHMGPDPSLDIELEELICWYVRDSVRIGMPRNQQQCLHHIEIYLRTYGINVPQFTNGKPGIYATLSFLKKMFDHG